MYAATDLAFQVISDSSITSMDVVNSNGDVISSNTGFTSVGGNVYIWQESIDISDLACDECFQLIKD